jgi:hypothetical protein
MSSIKLKHSGGNGVIIAAPSSNPDADRTITVPSTVSGTMLTSTSGSSIRVLEQFYSSADGSSFTTSQGTITLTDVTSVLNLTTSFQDLPGTSITYTPPSGTSHVIYEVQFGLRSDDSSAILGGHMMINSDIILDSRFGLRGSTNYSDMLYTFKFGINIGGSSSTTTGRQAAWTSGKTLKLQLNEHNSSYEWRANILGNYGADGHQGVTMRPRVGITAIGVPS